MNGYSDFMIESLRLAILKFLYVAPSYTLNEIDLKKSLSARGQAVSTDILRSNLQWLHEQSVLLATQADGIWIATLTAKGGDVVNGLTTVPSIARPEPN